AFSPPILSATTLKFIPTNRARRCAPLCTICGSNAKKLPANPICVWLILYHKASPQPPPSEGKAPSRPPPKGEEKIRTRISPQERQPGRVRRFPPFGGTEGGLLALSPSPPASA